MGDGNVEGNIKPLVVWTDTFTRPYNILVSNSAVLFQPVFLHMINPI